MSERISENLLKELAVNTKYYATEENIRAIAKELLDLRHKVKLLKEDAERLADKVEWHSKHHQFIENCYEDILFYHKQVMSEVENE